MFRSRTIRASNQWLDLTNIMHIAKFEKEKKSLKQIYTETLFYKTFRWPMLGRQLFTLFTTGRWLLEVLFISSFCFSGIVRKTLFVPYLT